MQLSHDGDSVGMSAALAEFPASLQICFRCAGSPLSNSVEITIVFRALSCSYSTGSSPDPQELLKSEESPHGQLLY